jgi:hypothetical protein
MPDDIAERCNTIEECYEFMLAYAAQGVPAEAGSASGARIREFLNAAVSAISGLTKCCAMTVKQQGLEPSGPYDEFIAVVGRDARDSLAAIGLVLAQPSISSQLIDNLNASIHLRALLTDLFLLSDIFELNAPASVKVADSSDAL